MHLPIRFIIDLTNHIRNTVSGVIAQFKFRLRTFNQYRFCFLGVADLISDNHTEHGRTINILARMNIYQEVVLAALYKTLPAMQVRQFNIEKLFFFVTKTLHRTVIFHSLQ